MHGTSPDPGPENGTTESLTLSLDEVAFHLRVTERYVRMLTTRRELPSFMLGKRRLVRRSDLIAFTDGLAEQERQLRERISETSA